MDQKSIPALVVATILLLLGGILGTLFGFILVNFSPGGSTITINGNTYAAGTPQYKQTAQIVLTIGLVVLFIGIILLIMTIIMIKKYPPQNKTVNNISQSSSSTSDFQPGFIPPKNYPFTEEPQQTNSFANSVQGVNSYANSQQQSDTFSNAPQQNKSYNNNTQQSDSFYNDAQQLDPFSSSNKESSDTSFSSDKFCPSCGSLIKQNERFCNNCGAKL